MLPLQRQLNAAKRAEKSMIMQKATQSELENLRQDLNNIELRLEQTRQELQKKNLIPYDEESEYWKSYEGGSSCEEGVKKCV